MSRRSFERASPESCLDSAIHERKRSVQINRSSRLDRSVARFKARYGVIKDAFAATQQRRASREALIKTTSPKASLSNVREPFRDLLALLRFVGDPPRCEVQK